MAPISSSSAWRQVRCCTNTGAKVRMREAKQAGRCMAASLGRDVPVYRSPAPSPRPRRALRRCRACPEWPKSSSEPCRKQPSPCEGGRSGLRPARASGAYIAGFPRGAPKMSWTPEQRRRYAPAISDVVRANATVRLAATIDAIDPPARTGRPRSWSTLTMLQALWWLGRAGSAWKLLPAVYPPRQTIGSRLERWVRLGVLDRALAVLNACLDRKSVV